MDTNNPRKITFTGDILYLPGGALALFLAVTGFSLISVGLAGGLICVRVVKRKLSQK